MFISLIFFYIYKNILYFYFFIKKYFYKNSIYYNDLNGIELLNQILSYQRDNNLIIRKEIITNIIKDLNENNHEDNILKIKLILFHMKIIPLLEEMSHEEKKILKIKLKELSSSIFKERIKINENTKLKKNKKKRKK